MSSSSHKPCYEFADVPEAGEIMAITPHIKWLRMPLPFALNHINLWLLADGDSAAIVDTGIYMADARAIWEKTIAEQLGGRAPTRVVVTHMHPDHVGNAGWLCATHDIELWMTFSEYYNCRVLVADTGRKAPPEGITFYTALGFTPEQTSRYRKMFGLFGKAVSVLPEQYRRLRGGERLAFGEHEFEVLIGNGHSPEHACLFSAELNVIFSGDQILPTISSNVSVWPTEPDANPLDDWLASCRRLRNRLPEGVLVLPAHGKPFRGARERLTGLIEEHEMGLAKLYDLCAEPKRAVDVFGVLFNSKISASNLIMAAGEALAHLTYLERRGQLRGELDAAGVRWYERL